MVETGFIVLIILLCQIFQVYFPGDSEEQVRLLLSRLEAIDNKYIDLAATVLWAIESLIKTI